MKKTCLFVLCGLLMGVGAASALDLVMDVRPGTLLVGSKSGHFKAWGPGTGPNVTVVEELGGLSTMPNLRIGVGKESDKWYLDGSGVAGVLVNDRFRAVSLGLDAAAQYRYRKNIVIGPHIGINHYMSPDWSGDALIDFSNTWGFILGGQMCIGYDVLFVFSVDYLYTDPFDFTVSHPWQVNEDSVDFSGLFLQFGIRGKF